MEFSRHFFTASRRKGGFYTFAQTQDLDEDFLQSKIISRSLLSYSKPSNMEEPKNQEDLVNYPVSHRFYVIEGARFFSTIHYTGRSNHTPNRFGNYFADTIIANNSEKPDFENATPFNIFNFEKIDWIKSVQIESENEISDYLEKLEVPFKESTQHLMLNKIIEIIFFSTNFEKQISTLSLLLNTILEEALNRPRKKIIIYGNELEIRRWVLISTGLFSSEFLQFISFTTYFNDPVYSPFFINGLIPESGISPTSLEKDGEKYKVILLDSPSQQNISYGNEYVQLICTLIEQKDVEEIAELLNEDYDSFGVTQLDSSLNRVAKFRIILDKIKPGDINFREVFTEFENLRDSLPQGVNIDPKKVILFEKAARVNPGALDEFFKFELQASTIQDALKTITLLYKDYYLRYLKQENSEGADTPNYPNQFLEYSLKQASDKLIPLDFSRLCLDLFSKLEEHLDQINSDVFNLMGVAAVKLLEPELLNATEQQAILDQLRPLNSKYQLNLNLEPEFEVYQIVDDIENDIIKGNSWSEKIRLFFVGIGKRVSKSKVFIYLRKLLAPLFKKKLSKGDWIDLFVLTHAELNITDADLISILKSQVLESDFSIRQKKYFFRNMILTCSKHGLNSILKLSLDDDEILQSIVFDDFVEYLEDCIEINEKEYVKLILSLLKEKKGGDKS